MGTTDPRVDAYIAKAAPFAHPILEHLRQAVHAACPQVEETIKWGMPNFMYGGKILANMAAFKAHCAFGFWRRDSGDTDKGGEAMGQFGRIESVKDLPPKAGFAKLVKAQMALIDSGEGARPAPKREAKPPAETPPDLAAALKKNAAARKTWDAFAPSHKRDYVEWIVEAKREETRAKRLAQTLEQLAEGKKRNWKYENC
jgi:uncharacterized protein YdeI (YjbR/CyaY-like superfamily)